MNSSTAAMQAMELGEGFRALTQGKEVLAKHLQERRELIDGWMGAERDPFGRHVLATGLRVISETEKHLAERDLRDPTIQLGITLIDSIFAVHKATCEYLMRTGRRSF